MYVVKQLLQNELGNSGASTLVRVYRAGSAVLQIPFSSVVEKVQKNQIT